MADALGTLKANRTRFVTLAVLAFLFFTAVSPKILLITQKYQ